MILRDHLCAHRGWTRTHLENTLPALREAVERGCRAVEFDVRRTLDDDWIVYHDADLRRLHDHPERVAERTRAELESLGLPALATALELFDEECLPLVEVKEVEPTAADRLVAILGDAAARIPLVAISRGPRLPWILIERLPTVPVFLYTRSWTEAQRLAGSSLAGFDLSHRGIPREEIPDRVTAIRSAGKKIAVFTINDPAVARPWLRAGVDWVITDEPWRYDARGT